MRWRRLRWLAAKEWRELAASRATLLVAIALGPLVGHAFTTAVNAYAEMSGIGGGPAALAQGLSPLDGLVVPTFGVYAIVSTLLFPFVAIRLVSAEKERGSLKLLLQAPVGLATMTTVKLAVLLAAWIMAWIPGLIALGLWKAYGGHLDASEVTAVLVGHALRGALVTAVAMAAAALTDGAASAAVATLAVTLGTWALDFVAQVQGGLAQRLDRFTPEALLRTFERGELRLDLVGVTVVVVAALIAVAVIWLHPGRPLRTRALATALAVAALALGAPLAAMVHGSWDVSADRRNSLPPADERALRQLTEPLRVTAYLAPEDPRLADLERGVFHKLARTVRDFSVTTVAGSSTGLFEKPGQQYGEVWYAIGDRRAMTRSTTEPIVLETIYGIAGLEPPAPDSAAAYPGHPLRTRPAGAALLFYGMWPIAVALLWWWGRRGGTPR